MSWSPNIDDIYYIILGDDNLGLVTKYYVFPIIIHSPFSVLQEASQVFLPDLHSFVFVLQVSEYFFFV
jgi:hypothetical protein